VIDANGGHSRLTKYMWSIRADRTFDRSDAAGSVTSILSRVALACAYADVAIVDNNRAVGPSGDP